eukprot:6213295-Pleurochrysis_carterae.AAC.3
MRVQTAVWRLGGGTRPAITGAGGGLRPPTAPATTVGLQRVLTTPPVADRARGATPRYDRGDKPPLPRQRRRGRVLAAPTLGASTTLVKKGRPSVEPTAYGSRKRVRTDQSPH